MKIIINADDFGYSSKMNHTISQAMKENLISSTTLLVNMPGFDEAAEMAKNKDFINRVGIHLNLFEGEPLTRAMQKCSQFCNKDGIYHGKYENEVFEGKKIQFLDPLKINSKIIYDELYAQIDKVIRKGIKPTHLDSHANRHTNYFIGNILIKLAKQFDIPSIRINRNLRPNVDIFHKTVVNIYNKRLKKRGIKCVDYFGTIPDVSSILHSLNGSIEIVVHTVLEDDTIMDYDFETKTTYSLAQFQKYKKVSYKHL